MVREICMIENFILPSLIDKKFGYLMDWDNEEEKIFKVFWSHKSRKQWTRVLFAVFLEWDKIKGRTELSEPEFFTKSKGRFRSALNRLSSCGKLRKLRSSRIGYRMYQLIEPQEVNGPAIQVPDVYVELPVLEDEVEVLPFYAAEPVHPNEKENENIQSNYVQNDLQSLEDFMDFYEGMPDEFSCCLDDINGDILTINNIEEPLMIPEDFSLEENDDGIISQEFIDLFKDDNYTFPPE